MCPFSHGTVLPIYFPATRSYRRLPLCLRARLHEVAHHVLVCQHRRRGGGDGAHHIRAHPGVERAPAFFAEDRLGGRHDALVAG